LVFENGITNALKNILNHTYVYKNAVYLKLNTRDLTDAYDENDYSLLTTQS